MWLTVCLLLSQAQELNNFWACPTYHQTPEMVKPLQLLKFFRNGGILQEWSTMFMPWCPQTLVTEMEAVCQNAAGTETGEGSSVFSMSSPHSWLVLASVFKESSVVASFGPDIAIFKQFQQSWNYIDQSSYDSADKHKGVSHAAADVKEVNVITEFVLNQLSETQPCDDYGNLLDYTNIPWNHSAEWRPVRGTGSIPSRKVAKQGHIHTQNMALQKSVQAHSSWGKWTPGCLYLHCMYVYTPGRGILLPLQLVHQTMTWCFFNNLLGINQSIQPCQRSPAANLQDISGTWMRILLGWLSMILQSLLNQNELCWEPYRRKKESMNLENVSRLTWCSVLIWQWRTFLWKEYCHSLNTCSYPLASLTSTWYYGMMIQSTSMASVLLVNCVLSMTRLKGQYCTLRTTMPSWQRNSETVPAPDRQTTSRTLTRLL